MPRSRSRKCSLVTPRQPTSALFARPLARVLLCPDSSGPSPLASPTRLAPALPLCLPCPAPDLPACPPACLRALVPCLTRPIGSGAVRGGPGRARGLGGHPGSRALAAPPRAPLFLLTTRLCLIPPPAFPRFLPLSLSRPLSLSMHSPHSPNPPSPPQRACSSPSAHLLFLFVLNLRYFAFLC